MQSINPSYSQMTRETLGGVSTPIQQLASQALLSGLAQRMDPFATQGWNQLVNPIVQQQLESFGHSSLGLSHPLSQQFSGVMSSGNPGVYCYGSSNPLLRSQGISVNPLLQQQGVFSNPFVQQSVLTGASLAHIGQDLIHDRIRDKMNLGLVEDLIDSQNTVAYSRQPWLQQATKECAKQILRDAMYNRKADEIIRNIATGQVHLPRADEQMENLRNCMIDRANIANAQHVLREAQFSNVGFVPRSFGVQPELEQRFGMDFTGRQFGELGLRGLGYPQVSGPFSQKNIWTCVI